MLSCKDVAKYFLSLADEDAGELISNLKLQKLIYYAQGFHLALFNSPLFRENIVAWEHGPVVPSLYHDYKEYGAGAIPKPNGFDFGVFDAEKIELMDEVYAVYGQFSAWKLREMTHNEAPFKETKKNCPISRESMRTHFKGLLRHGKNKTS